MQGEDYKDVRFRFGPVLLAAGCVRNAWTGGYVGGAKVAFTAHGEDTNFVSGLSFDGYPAFARDTYTDESGATNTYKSYWYTRADGTFPTNVILPAVDWDLTLTCAGYSNLIVEPAITSRLPGANCDLEILYMTPADTNANGIGDAWETEYQVTDRDADPDGDGHSNWCEYRCGTDPTTNASVLGFTNGLADVNGLTLVWPVAPGRRYRVRATNALGAGAGAWGVVYGPREAAYGETHMRWTDTNAVTRPNRYYRVHVVTNDIE
jgi:hypothetical protein